MTPNYVGNSLQLEDEDGRFKVFVEGMRPLEYVTFRQYVDTRAVTASLGYAPNQKMGLTLANDWQVTCHAGRYKGTPVVAIKVKGILHVFSKETT